MERVVVTGIGIVSSIGMGKTAFWENVIAGKSGIGTVQGFDTSHYPTHVGGEIRDFVPIIRNGSADNMGLCTQYAVTASRMAYEDAGITDSAAFAKNTGVFIGTTMGENKNIRIPEIYNKNIAAAVSEEFGIHNMPTVIPNACSAGNFAISAAYEKIRRGELTYAIAGGADAFSETAFVGFSRLRSVAPEKCCPFDKNRSGMLLGEGAGAFVMESLSSALRRGTEVYAEIIGWGASCDAYNMAMPHPRAEGLESAIEKAMENAGISSSDVDYISAHGTGTRANDAAEAFAINRIFKRRVPVSSIKSMIGHSMGASSIIEAALCCLTIKNGIIAPTINYTEPDEECDIDCVPNTARRCDVRIALNNSSAFGGNNNCVLFKRI